MSCSWWALVVGAVVALGAAAAASADVFTYQGRLLEGGQPATGPLNLSFRLYDAVSGGLQIGSENVLVGFDEFAAGGEFTVDLDFGAGAFSGQARWLEVWAGGAPLSPRQPLQPSPYALHAMNAAMVPDGGLPATYASAVDFTNAGNAFSGSGAGLTGLDASNLSTGTVAGGRLAGTYGNALTFSNAGNLFTGNGGGLSNLNWNNLVNVPLSFADGQDNDTIVWSTIGSDAYYTAGRVGVGTSSPINRFHVEVTGENDTAVFGVHNSTSGFGVGGILESKSISGTGVRGVASATTGSNRGVVGASNSSEGIGVVGLASTTSGVNYGVRGATNSSQGYAGHFIGGRNYFEGDVGIGVADPAFPLHVNATGPTAIYAINTAGDGVLGETSDQGGNGVHGFASAISGASYGVFGVSNSDQGAGVVGIVHATSGTNYGVYGQSRSTNGRGVYGLADATTGISSGVFGQADSPTGRGVFGLANAASGENFAVIGSTNSNDGYAGFFQGGRNYFSGNVGIGTLDPAAGLHVEGLDFPKTFVLMNATDPAGDAGIRFSRQGTVRWHIFNNGGASDLLSIYNSAFSPVFTATQGGNVGIGMANPTFQLQLSTNSAAKPTSSSWTIASDRRLKEDIRTIDGALEDLLRLRGVKYRWIDPDSQGGMDGVYTGLIAQEVEAVFPEWVRESADGYKTLTVIGFEGIVVEALRELQAKTEGQISAQAERIVALEAENAAFRERLAQMEAAVDRLLAAESR